MRSLIAMAALIVVLAIVNYAIYDKEEHLRNGKIVYLQLAPVDPRSLMQGDYMALRFVVANKIRDRLPKSKMMGSRNIDAPDGAVVVTLDERRIATFKAIFEGQPLLENEMLLRYRVRGNSVKFATNAYFFEEGQGSHYSSARYGQFMVNDGGELLLTAMYDDDLKAL